MVYGRISVQKNTMYITITNAKVTRTKHNNIKKIVETEERSIEIVCT